MNLQSWIDDVERLLAELSAIDLGYPQGTNAIHPPASSGAIEHSSNWLRLRDAHQLIEFYRHCDGLSLPDVHNGYFIHRIGHIHNGVDRGEPSTVSGPLGGRVVCFGSDGGGGRFALNTETEQVLVLRGGEVVSNMFKGEQKHIKRVANDFESFLERLHSDIHAFVTGTPDHPYMA